MIFEILWYDQQTSSSFQPTSFDLPKIDFSNVLVPGAMTIISAVIFIMLAVLMYNLFRLLKISGGDEEITAKAKVNIKNSLIFIFISSLSWVALSVILHRFLVEN
ncbi:MAG: hypothetical protein PHH01_02980 [Patescibacteria group bacterium]|nr:hypothetical protein [Patescibacteria group bacterium]